MLQRADLPMIWLFLYLQVLDVLTTLLGFSIGAGEGSPLVRLLVLWGPVAGLVASKLGAVALATICLWLRKQVLLRWINYWYAALVVWNILVSLRLLTAEA